MLTQQSIEFNLDAFRPNPDAIARRSISIFSRRGIESVVFPDNSIGAFPAAFHLQRSTAISRKTSARKSSIPRPTNTARRGTTNNAVARKPFSTLGSVRESITQDPEASFVVHRRLQAGLQHDRIGLWVDGVANCDEDLDKRTRSASDAGYRKKPSLTVQIPNATIMKRPATAEGQHQKSSTRQEDTLDALKSMSVFSPLEHTAEPSRSASTCSSDHLENTNSSKRSSATSVEITQRPQSKRLSSDSTIKQKTSKTIDSTDIGLGRRASYVNKSHKIALSPEDNVSVINGDDIKTEQCTPTTKVYMDKPLPPVPGSTIAHLSLRMPASLPPLKQAKPSTLRSSKSARTAPKKKQSLRPSKSMSKLDQLDHDFMRTSPYIFEDSPTLSQAEIELHEHLGRISQRLSKADAFAMNQTLGLGITGVAILRSSLVEPPSRTPTIPKRNRARELIVNVEPPSRTPTIPRKSRRRDWRRSASPANKADNALLRRGSDPSSFSNHDAPPAEWWLRYRIDRAATSAKISRHVELIARQDVALAHQVPAKVAAEGVLVNLLASMTSIGDLMNVRMINKGMYKVYKENEQALVQKVARNESLPGCELREWWKPGQTSFEESDNQVQSPASYIRDWSRDEQVINKLKGIIVTECQSFIRRQTVAAMKDKLHPQAQRVADAFWRIWTFCTIFGSHKGRDEDLNGQLDWLKGGRVANNLDCAATVVNNFEFDVGSILLNAPEYFGKGNGEGLSADELYDITEIWTCMAALLQGYLGRVDQARKYGIYDQCDIEKGDVEKEEYMLEEWIAWILTLGPVVVLDLIQYASDKSSKGFALAAQKGWTKWAPPQQTTSRVTFLKEPVARLYEERVTSANAKAQTDRERAEKVAARRRIAAHAFEIRSRRQDSAFKRVPLIDMSMERPMSVMSTLSAVQPLTPRFPPRSMTLPTHSASRTASTTMLSPSSIAGMPSISVTQHYSPERSELRAFNGVDIGTAELAIERIVAMGFPENAAKEALKTTDDGSGLRVDRAIDYLVRKGL